MKTTKSTARAGFTLIEVLAVIVILGILMIVLLPRLTGATERAKERSTGVWIQSIDAAAKDYEGRFGDFPPSQFQEKWGTAPNLTNMGGETLVVSLWSTEWNGTMLAEDKFSNTDNDETKRPLTRFPANALQELKDDWGNPIAYFHRRDYGRTDNYVVTTADTGEIEELPVKAFMNPATKTYFNSNTFQLISAGVDGKFGTEDDITNFKRD
jgi:prepilin-type N-terminal cleavage/methylation domain-containing protein